MEADVVMLCKSTAGKTTLGLMEAHWCTAEESPLFLILLSSPFLLSFCLFHSSFLFSSHFLFFCHHLIFSSLVPSPLIYYSVLISTFPFTSSFLLLSPHLDCCFLLISMLSSSLIPFFCPLLSCPLPSSPLPVH